MTKRHLIIVAIGILLAAFIGGVVATAIAQPGEDASAIPAELLAPADVTVLDLAALRLAPGLMNTAKQCNLLYMRYATPPETDVLTWMFASSAQWPADSLASYLDLLMARAIPNLPAAAWQIQVLDATNSTMHYYSDGEWTQAED